MQSQKDTPIREFPAFGDPRNGPSDGCVLEAHASEGDTGFKTTKDGRLFLVPQPSDDPDDPLNWSSAKKHLLLFTISAAAFLPDYGTSIGAVTLIPQATEWHVTQDGMLRSLVGSLFMAGAAGIFVVVFMAYFGRLPILFWFLIMSLWTAILCAAAPDLNTFIAARVVSGTFSTVTQASGLIFISDLFFLHEYARKINIWSFAIILSPYLGPLITAFIISKYSWRWSFWLNVLITGICLLLTIVWGEETYYERKAVEPRPQRKSWILRLLGTEQWRTRKQRNPSFMDAVRPALVILQPVVFISCVYYLLIFSWVIGVNATLSIFLQPLYDFGPQQIGFFYFTPIISTILGELSGQFIHDLVARASMKRTQGHLVPEARLWVMYIATPVMIAGLVLLGFGLQYAYHYMWVAFGWGLYVYGIMVATVGINAYVLNSYPEESGEVAAWLNFARILGGFLITYFQVRWAASSGPKNSFGVQAALVGGAFLLIVILQLYGSSLRQWKSPFVSRGSNKDA